MRKCSAFTHRNRSTRAETVTAQIHSSISYLDPAFDLIQITEFGGICPEGTQDTGPWGRAGQNRDVLSPLGARVLETKQEMKIITIGPESIAKKIALPFSLQDTHPSPAVEPSQKEHEPKYQFADLSKNQPWCQDCSQDT